MTADQRRDERRTAVDAAMGVAADVAEGRLSPLQLDAQAVQECRQLAGTVVGPDDPLWPLQCEVARQVLAAGGVPANELQEWLAVQRARDGVPVVPVAAGGSWIEQALAAVADEELADA